MSLNVGDRIGDYQVVSVLGAGGMGRVYKVRNVISDRIEAMKVLLPNLESQGDLVDRFLREIKVQAGLVHSNIAALHTAQRVDNRLLMLMEYVEGETVEQALRGRAMPVAQAVDCVSQVLAALAYAHGRGVVHRDIKPANIMLMPSGTVKLMDFGIARMAADRKLTQTGHTVGSLYYMSPEQIQGVADLSPRADIYSLGITLYEMVTGQRPFQGDSDYSIMAAHLQTPPVPPVELDPRLPAPLSDVVLTAIAKDPQQRFQSADAFRAALQRSTAAPPRVAAAPPPVPYTSPAVPAPPSPRVSEPVIMASSGAGSRRGLYMAAGALAVVAVLGAGAWVVPSLLGTKANTTPVANVSKPKAPTPLPSPAAAAPLTSVPGATPPAQPMTQPTVGAASVASTRPSDSSGAPTSPLAQPTRVRPTLPSDSRSPVAQVAPPSRAMPSNATPAQTYQAPAVTSTPSTLAATPPDPRQSPEFREWRERYNQVALRAGSLGKTFANRQREQSAMGLGMRNDWVATRDRMNFQLEDAQGALRAGDLEGLKRNLTMAERAVDQLATAFGQ